MPCKNAGPFLKECIDSIIAQTYANWELIVCDDGSTDDSLSQLLSYQEKHGNIYILQNNGSGILDALNQSYQETKGKYITRMDADDIMPKGKIEALVLLLGSNSKNKVATGKVQYFPEEEIKDGFKAYESWMNGLIDHDNHWQEIYKECVIASTCWMMDRVSFDRIGGFGTDYPEDYDLVWRMFMNQINVAASSQILHFWRDHPTRTSRNSDVYQTQTYFSLKVKYMLQMEQIRNKQIVVWGAGRKGKSLVKELRSKGIQPVWVTNNPKKIGQDIYSIIVQEFGIINHNDSKLIILLTVSSHDDQRDLHDFLHRKNYQRSIDYFVLA